MQYEKQDGFKILSTVKQTERAGLYQVKQPMVQQEEIGLLD